MARSLDPKKLDILQEVVQGTSQVVGTEFFRCLVRSLASALGVRYCFVTECLDQPPTRVRTLAFWGGDHFFDNFDYPLATTPCEQVISGQGFCFDDLIQERFPDDQDLVDLEAQSYAAVPLMRSDGVVVGHLAVLDVEVFSAEPPDLTLLDLFAGRAAAEIERMAALERVSNSEARLRQVIDLVPHFIFAKDEAGRFILANNASAEALNTVVEDLIGKTDADFSATPEEVEHFRRDDLEVLRSGRSKTVSEETLTDADGNLRYLKTTKIPFTTADLDSPALLGIAIDITEERRLQKRLHAILEGTAGEVGEAFLRSLTKHLAMALGTKYAVIAEIQGDQMMARTVWVGENFQDNLGYPLPGSPCERVVQVDGPVQFTGGLCGLFPESDLLADLAAESFLGTPLVDTSGKTIGVLSVVHTEPLEFSEEDRNLMSIFASRVTTELERERSEAQRQRLQAQLLHVQKLESLGILAGGIAHDFNNLLSAILGNTVLAMESVADDAPAVEFLRSIEAAALRSAELSGQMLAYSGKGSFIIEPLDVNHLVRELLPLLSTSISKKAHLDFHLSDDLASVDGDATQVRQVIMNLVTNASDALDEQPGSIRLETGVRHFGRVFLSQTYLDEIPAAGRYVYLEVRDDGCGMSEQTMERLFDPFFTTKDTGRGLGLAALLGIVRGHGGAVRVDSREGCGSTFTILFPIGQGSDPAAVGPAAVARRSASRQGSVLFVDDEELIREVGRSSLQSAGFGVLLAENGRQAVEVFRRHEGDIIAVVLDMMMPELDGVETCRELRRLCPSVPCILSSGYSDQAVEKAFQAEGMDGFLKKPYRPEQLAQTLADVLDRPAAP